MVLIKAPCRPQPRRMNYSNMSPGKPAARALFSFNLNTLILHARSGERQARDRFRQHLTATSTILRGEGGDGRRATSASSMSHILRRLTTWLLDQNTSV